MLLSLLSSSSLLLLQTIYFIDKMKPPEKTGGSGNGTEIAGKGNLWPQGTQSQTTLGNIGGKM